MVVADGTAVAPAYLHVGDRGTGGPDRLVGLLLFDVEVIRVECESETGTEQRAESVEALLDRVEQARLVAVQRLDREG